MKKAHKEYDKFLRSLPKNGNPVVSWNFHEVDLTFLEGRGFLKLDWHSEGIDSVSLTPRGNVFIAEGGFKNEWKKRMSEIVKFWSSWAISLIALAISYYTFEDARNSDKDLELKFNQFKKRIESLERYKDSVIQKNKSEKKSFASKLSDQNKR